MRSATPLSSMSPASWPKRVVDVLEAVQVQEQDRGHGPGARRARAMPSARRSLQQHAVGQVGERIVVGQALDLLLRLDRRGDVAQRDDRDGGLQAALAHECHADVQRAPAAVRRHVVALAQGGVLGRKERLMLPARARRCAKLTRAAGGSAAACGRCPGSRRPRG